MQQARDLNKSGTVVPQLKALIYARVSSKEQEKEGFSIPAQLKLLQGYAETNRLNVAQEFVDIETAKQTGRLNFEEMVRYLKTHPNVRMSWSRRPTAFIATSKTGRASMSSTLKSIS